MKIPGLILKQMYALGSLRNAADGVHFSLKNRLADATLTRLAEVSIDGARVPLERLILEPPDGEEGATTIGPGTVLPLPLSRVVRGRAHVEPLATGPHDI